MLNTRQAYDTIKITLVGQDERSDARRGGILAGKARRSRTTRGSAELAINTEVPTCEERKRLSKVGPKANRALAIFVGPPSREAGRVLSQKWLRIPLEVCLTF